MTTSDLNRIYLQFKSPFFGCLLPVCSDHVRHNQGCKLKRPCPPPQTPRRRLDRVCRSSLQIKAKAWNRLESASFYTFDFNHGLVSFVPGTVHLLYPLFSNRLGDCAPCYASHDNVENAFLRSHGIERNERWTLFDILRWNCIVSPCSTAPLCPTRNYQRLLRRTHRLPSD